MPHPRVAQRLPLAQLAVVLIAQVGCTSGSSGLSPLEVDLPDDSVVVAPGSTIHIADGASCPTLTWSEPMARCFAAYEHERGGDTTIDSAWPSRDPFALCPDLREITVGRSAVDCIVRSAAGAQSRNPWKLEFGVSPYNPGDDRDGCYWFALRDAATPGCEVEVIVVEPVTGTIRARFYGSRGLP